MRAGRADARLESFAPNDGALHRELAFKQNGKAENGPPRVGRFFGIGRIPAGAKAADRSMEGSIRCVSTKIGSVELYFVRNELALVYRFDDCV